MPFGVAPVWLAAGSYSDDRCGDDSGQGDELFAEGRATFLIRREPHEVAG
jgi:hypothetical protein